MAAELAGGLRRESAPFGRHPVALTWWGSAGHWGRSGGCSRGVDRLKWAQCLISPRARVLLGDTTACHPQTSMARLNNMQVLGLFDFRRAPSVSSLTFGGYAGFSATVLGGGSCPGF